MWLLLLFTIIVMAIWFADLYFRDRDKRKLMFAIAFLASSISFLILALGYNTLEYGFIYWNLYHWASMPIMVAILIAANESIYKVKDFDRIFKLFIAVFFISCVMTVVPFDFKPILTISRQILAVEIIIVSAYIFIERREFSSLMFLLAMVCFTIAWISLARALEYLPIFSLFMAHIFLGLIFISPSTSEERKGVGSYFSLKYDLVTLKKALKGSEEKLRLFSQAVESSIDGIAMADPESGITYVNDVFVKMFGYSQDELIGKNITVIYVADQRPKLKDAIKATMEGGWRGELVAKRKNGDTFPIAVSLSIITDDNGKVVAQMTSHRDITERKQAEQARIASEQKYRRLVDNLSAVVLEVDAEGKIIYASPQITELFGFKPEEVIGKDAFEFIHPDDIENALDRMAEAIKLGKMVRVEYRTRHKDGHYVPIYGSGKIIGDGADLRIISVIRAISDRKPAVDEIKKSQ